MRLTTLLGASIAVLPSLAIANPGPREVVLDEPTSSDTRFARVIVPDAVCSRFSSFAVAAPSDHDPPDRDAGEGT